LAKHCRQRCKHAGSDEAYAQEADFTASDATGFFEILLDVAEDTTSTLEKDLASACELDGARGAKEESVAKNLLELSNLLGERRLGEMKALRCATEVQLLGDGDKVAEMA
jgi:hypothetical protein